MPYVWTKIHFFDWLIFLRYSIRFLRSLKKKSRMQPIDNLVFEWSISFLKKNIDTWLDNIVIFRGLRLKAFKCLKINKYTTKNFKYGRNHRQNITGKDLTYSNLNIVIILVVIVDILFVLNNEKSETINVCKYWKYSSDPPRLSTCFTFTV